METAQYPKSLQDLYAIIAYGVEPWAVATTSLDALASDISELIAPDDEIDLYAMARTIQRMAEARM